MKTRVETEVLFVIEEIEISKQCFNVSFATSDISIEDNIIEMSPKNVDFDSFEIQ